MFLYVFKQTFRKVYGYITGEFLGLRMRSFQGIIFMWAQAYRETFKSALEYLKVAVMWTWYAVTIKQKYSRSPIYNRSKWVKLPISLAILKTFVCIQKENRGKRIK